MHVIEPLLVLIDCYLLVLVESVSRWVSSTATELFRGCSVRFGVSVATELSSTATELSSMAMKLSFGGDGALSRWLSSNRR
ncbi:hypothetical protein Bca52824_018258 [Brassica carinata]|uniref:Secreted protein n=1 Tax=Brassica carinata TaxID=52824 RepID=A0A8X7VPE2_BRACI|nr:hypothetical protein Bca52824_018258 [Brassica carinata]